MNTTHRPSPRSKGVSETQDRGETAEPGVVRTAS